MLTMEELEKLFNTNKDTQIQRHQLIIPEYDNYVKHFLYAGQRIMWVDRKLHFAVITKTNFKSQNYQRVVAAYKHFLLTQNYRIVEE